MTYVDLNRGFHDLTQRELDDPDLLASLNEFSYGMSPTWEDLLEHPRVLLLAEAGSGKTDEMREQTRSLLAQGHCAFYVALEALGNEMLEAVLSPEELARLQAWQNDPQGAVAWFFLDAVDELKLTDGKLERALQRLANALTGQLGRARIVMSSRPHDWRPASDLATFEATLPVPEMQDALPDPEELFLEGLRSHRTRVSEDKRAASLTAVRTVTLLPLSEPQIRRFATHVGAGDVESFLRELDRQDAWVFARRPLDLIELLISWGDTGRLGNRIEQHEANVRAKLHDDPSRADRGVLTDEKARFGTERLALALALTRTRTLRAQDQPLQGPRSDGVLDPSRVLDDWTEKERQVLLRRGLFDPATYGRVRFHHRSVQEYLAAVRLRDLRERGMSTPALFRLLFGVQYGERIVLPSMRPIAAWLALWDDAVRRELISREPEILLTSGDPASLPVTARAQLLRSFLALYASGDWRGIELPRDELRRLAHPDLAGEIRAAWAQGSTNPEVRELLVKLIWQGGLTACMDLARAAALDPDWPLRERNVACQALVETQQTSALREIASSLFAHPKAWPADLVPEIAQQLFPHVLSVEELMHLVERTPVSGGPRDGFERAFYTLEECLDPGSSEAIGLREALAELIWRGRDSERELFEPHSRFQHLAAVLARLCARAIERGAREPSLIRCCVIASRFGGEEPAASDVEQLRERVRALPVPLRASAFWCELSLIDTLSKKREDGRGRLYHAEYGSLLGVLQEGDRPWLEQTLTESADRSRQSIALHALLSLWIQRGRDESELAQLRTLIRSDEEFEAIVLEYASPAVASDIKARAQRREQESAARRAKEGQRVEGWTTWRQKLIAEPAPYFEASRRRTTIRDLYVWVRSLPSSRDRYSAWNWKAMRHVYGPAVAELAGAALKQWWRANPPTLWSTRGSAERNVMPEEWIFGMGGISFESLSAGWAQLLQPDEARIAATYATIEMNGFAPFVDELTRVHPQVVDAVIGGELTEQLRLVGEYEHVPLLQDTSHAAQALQRLLAPRVLVALPAVPAVPGATANSRCSHHLDEMLRIVEAGSDESGRAQAATLCVTRYETDPSGALAYVWLRGLFRLDPPKAADLLASDLERTRDAPRARELFAKLFGNRDPVLLRIEDNAARATLLGRLLRLAYAFVRPVEDEPRDGEDGTTTRGFAESARAFLLSALIDTPGVEAHRTLLMLAEEDDLCGLADRLRYLARERAAKDAEFVPFDVQGLKEVDARFEMPPQDRDGLFQVMLDRLDDLAHDIAHHDFTDRRTLRTIQDEPEMQRTLALRLEAKARGSYRITREDEVADQKRTDIRLHAVRGDQRATIEVKLADERWSLSELEYALEQQLVGRYLRHAYCKAGCLLLTFDGTKSYWVHPQTNARLNFSEVLAHLQRKAQSLEAAGGYGIRLAVFGLDLTDPPVSAGSR